MPLPEPKYGDVTDLHDPPRPRGARPRPLRGRNGDHGDLATASTAGRSRRRPSAPRAATVETRHMPHSLHGCFLRPGPPTARDPLRRPRPRRRLVLSTPRAAIQDAKVIFSMLASFEVPSPSAPVEPPAHASRRSGRGRRVGHAGGEPGGHRALLPRLHRHRLHLVRVVTPLPNDPVPHRASSPTSPTSAAGSAMLGDDELPIGGPRIDHVMWSHDRPHRRLGPRRPPTRARLRRTRTYFGHLHGRDGTLAPSSDRSTCSGRSGEPRRARRDVAERPTSAARQSGTSADLDGRQPGRCSAVLNIPRPATS